MIDCNTLNLVLSPLVSPSMTPSVSDNRGFEQTIVRKMHNLADGVKTDRRRSRGSAGLLGSYLSGEHLFLISAFLIHTAVRPGNGRRRAIIGLFLFISCFPRTLRWAR